MTQENSTSKQPCNLNMWIGCQVVDYNDEIASYKANLSDSQEPFQSILDEGFIKILDDKIAFIQNGFIVAFIKHCDEVSYQTLTENNANLIKICKFGKETFISLDKQSLNKVDQSLKKYIFKNGFQSDFDIQSLIGNGSFSQVTLAKNKKDGKLYAIKTVQKNRISINPQTKKELMNEIHLLKRIDNEKVVKSYEFYSTENAFKMVLEYYAGGTLEQKLEKSQGFTLIQVCQIMKQVLQAFQYLHSLNIMHRDLKPDNILFCDKDNFDIVVSDVGLAQDVNEEFIFTKCGTPGYVAPEIINSSTGHDYDVKSDIFSCGALFYRLAIGKPLFSGQTHAEVLEQNKKCDINMSIPEFKALPQQIQKVMENMLQIDPSKRISAQEALDTLFYRLNANQQDYVCKNLVSKTNMNRKNTLNSQEASKILNIQHKQRNSVQLCSSTYSNCPSSKGSQTSVGSSSSSLQKTPIITKEKIDTKKSQYHKQETNEELNTTKQTSLNPKSPAKKQNSLLVSNSSSVLPKQRLSGSIQPEESSQNMQNLLSPGRNIQRKFMSRQVSQDEQSKQKSIFSNVK